MKRKPDTVAFWNGRLPHWEVVDGRYFVTIHLAGAIPQTGQDRIHALAADIEKLAQGAAASKLKIHRRVFAEMEAWLDRTERVTYLRHPAVAKAIMEAISFRHGKSWTMLEYVIMPNHVHLFFELLQEGLKRQLSGFKRWTGHAGSKCLGLNDSRFWQDEWFDHWSRSDDEDERIIEYIRQNPVKAGLVSNYRDWPYGGWNVK